MESNLEILAGGELESIVKKFKGTHSIFVRDSEEYKSLFTMLTNFYNDLSYRYPNKKKQKEIDRKYKKTQKPQVKSENEISDLLSILKDTLLKYISHLEKNDKLSRRESIRLQLAYNCISLFGDSVIKKNEEIVEDVKQEEQSSEVVEEVKQDEQPAEIVKDQVVEEVVNEQPTEPVSQEQVVESIPVEPILEQPIQEQDNVQIEEEKVSNEITGEEQTISKETEVEQITSDVEEEISAEESSEVEPAQKLPKEKADKYAYKYKGEEIKGNVGKELERRENIDVVFERRKALTKLLKNEKFDDLQIVELQRLIGNDILVIDDIIALKQLATKRKELKELLKVKLPKQTEHGIENVIKGMGVDLEAIEKEISKYKDV